MAAPPKSVVRMLLVGAGLIGRRHAAAIAAAPGAALAGVVDPDPAGGEVARAHDAPWFEVLEPALRARGADAVIVATPSALHAEGALAAIAAGLPTLVEKPIATALKDARAMVDAAARAGVPLAVGHHRRHHPVLEAARRRIEEGALGRVVAAHAAAWLGKPDGYFAPEWRRRPGAGPLRTNLIHDADALHFLCGPVEAVSAHVSSAARGHATEDTAVAALRFASGALGTLSVSDATVAPWSWELTARENPAYPPTGESALWIAGTRGSLSVPDGRLWHQEGGRDWWAPMATVHAPLERADPLARQIERFADLARGGAPPLATGGDGLRALAVIEAMERSAASGRAVALAELV